MRSTLTPLSESYIRNKKLQATLQPFAARHSINLSQYTCTDMLLNLLLRYGTSLPQDVAKIVQDSVQHLEEQWYQDIQRWRAFPSLDGKNPLDAGRYVQLVLRPMVTRRVFIALDPNGDIPIHSDQAGRLLSGRFHDLHLHGKAHLELDFLVGNQVKGLILPLEDTKKLDQVTFQHPKYAECVIFDLFGGDEFTQPRSDATAQKAELERQIQTEKDGERSD